MDESTFRERLRQALGETDLPPHVRDETRRALRDATAGEPHRTRFAGLVAVLLAVAIVAGLVGVNALRRSQTPVVLPPPAACAASSLVVTGTRGERLFSTELPPGFVLTGGNPDDLGSMGLLTYSVASGGDQPRVVLYREFTTQPLATLIGGGSISQSVTVQGKPALLVGGPPGPDFMNVAWVAGDGLVLIVGGYKISQTELLAVADHVQYVAGTQFTYPIQPRATVTREQALAALPGANGATLTSFGEADALIDDSAPVYVPRLPALNPSIEVIRPVWVVWTSLSLSLPARGFVIDATSGIRLVEFHGRYPFALGSLTDRSLSGCNPPFGVLTRSELAYFIPPIAGVASTVKLTTLGTLTALNSAGGDSFGNCSLLTCDPNVPVWLLIQTASDSRLMSEHPSPPNPGTSPVRPTPPTGSWAMRGLDARTGPQNTNLSGESAGLGPLPAELAAVPDLSSTTPIASPNAPGHLLIFTTWVPDPKVVGGPEPGYRPQFTGLTGHDIQVASAAIDDTGVAWVINIKFTPQGTSLLRALTRANVAACGGASSPGGYGVVCSQRHLAIWVDLTQADVNQWEDPTYVSTVVRPFDLNCLARASSNTVCPKLVSDPVTLQEIDSGNVTIAAGLTQQSAADLANAINAESHS
jgi:hypothetical protein